MAWPIVVRHDGGTLIFERTATGRIRVTLELTPLVPRAALAAASVVAALLVLEVGARVFHRPFFELGEYERWTSEVEETFTPPPNRFGHREEELGDGAFADGVTRILFLGDSFTYGHGVRDGSMLFTDRLERELDRRGDQIHVYNAGVSGANPREWKETLATLLPEYRPHLVIGVFFLRCGTSAGTSFRLYQRVVNRMRRKYERTWMHRSFALYRVWADARVRREFTEFYVAKLTSSYLGDETETEQWHKEQAALLEIAATCAEEGIPFHMVVFPMLFELRDYPFAAVESEIERFARESDIPLHSLTPAFLGNSASDLWVSPSDQHPNPEGHRIAAEDLLPWIESILGPGQ